MTSEKRLGKEWEGSGSYLLTNINAIYVFKDSQKPKKIWSR